MIASQLSMHPKIRPQGPTIWHPHTRLVSLATACHGPARQILKRPGSNASTSLASTKSRRRCLSPVSHLLSASPSTLISFLRLIDAANFGCSSALTSQAVYYPPFSLYGLMPRVGFSLSVALHLVLYQYLLSFSDIPCRARLSQDISNLVRSKASQRKQQPPMFRSQRSVCHSLAAYDACISLNRTTRLSVRGKHPGLHITISGCYPHTACIQSASALTASRGCFATSLPSLGAWPPPSFLSPSPSPSISPAFLPILLILTLLRLTLPTR